jgi:RHS repeat-associated protein
MYSPIIKKPQNTEFDYVTTIGYDEYGQRVYIKYGNGTESEYGYDPYRRWLAGLDTKNNASGQVQGMKYTFDAVGNVMGYENGARGYTTKQDYSYDGLYQLTGVRGTSRSHPYGGGEEYRTEYRQDYSFNRIGNMTSKASEESVSNTNRIGAELNYALDYEYYPGTHKAGRIGTRYYDYDLNGNISVEREGGHAVTAEADRAYYNEGDRYWTEYGFGLVKPKAVEDDGVYQRNYRWNERNLLSETVDGTYTVQYRYGADGQRALKFTASSGRSTVYFNRMWQTSDARADWVQSKHIYLNEDRIATKYNSEGNENTSAEKERTYYYHSDHLGSAQVVTNWRGQIHERLEYTPYGELWIDWKGGTALEDTTPFRFTGKEMDAETGFYYYGARYLDPKTSRWISADPALGEYVPSAPVDEEAKKRNGNLPGMGGVFNYVNMHVYHYAGNNPVKYTDPDGSIQVDANGGFYFWPDRDEDGNEIIVTMQGNSGKEIEVNRGYLKANDGTEVRARYNLSDVKAEDFDCHGYTFTNGTYWINNSEVTKILEGDGYTKSSVPIVGNVMIQKDKDGKITHSAIVESYNYLKGEVTVKEAMGTIEFRAPDGKLNRLRDKVYKIDGSQINGTLEFYNRPPDKVVVLE